MKDIITPALPSRIFRIPM